MAVGIIINKNTAFNWHAQSPTVGTNDLSDRKCVSLIRTSFTDLDPRNQYVVSYLGYH